MNVVDLMKLQPPSERPHGLIDKDFDMLFTTDKPIIFAYHGYPWLIHRLTYRRANHVENMPETRNWKWGQPKAPHDLRLIAAQMIRHLRQEEGVSHAERLHRGPGNEYGAGQHCLIQ